MSGLCTHQMWEWDHIEAAVHGIQDVRALLPEVIRKVIEGQTSLALDSKADREALIRDLIEALC